MKECPFCAGQTVELKEKINYGHGDCTCEVFVECNSCHAKGPDTGYYGSPTQEMKDNALRLWDKRPAKG